MNLLRTNRTRPAKPAELPDQPAGEPVLNIEDVSIAYKTAGRTRSAVDGVSLQLRPGEIVALVGESGSGKTTLASALLGLLPRNGDVVKGKIEVGGLDIVGYNEAQLRTIRGSIVGLVPQDPMVSLNPTMRIGQQVGETVRLRGVPKRSVNAEVLEFLERAGLDEPLHRARQYPHELSGGIRQRALIANALAGRPKVIIADEPTSALDVTVQRRMLDHLEKLVREEQIAMLLITHDLAVASDRADRVAVMQLGKIVEQGPSQEVLRNPQHPYTQKLLAVAPGFTFRHSVEVLAQHQEADSIPAAEHELTPAQATAQVQAPAVLELQDIVKDFHRRGGKKGDNRVRVLDGVSFKVPAHRTLALVGESGRGKTTLMRIAMRLTTPSSGTVLFDGSDITNLKWRELREFRQRFQLVHQDPFSSLDPRFTVEQSITEPLISYKVGDKASRRARALELLEQVALPRTYLSRKPAELSGGQRQRVAIARALSLKPELVMLDEPVSALDVSIQAQILELLRTLQQELGVAYLFITHDLAVVAEVAHEVAVLGPGKVAEVGPTATVFRSPKADETKLLIDAIPGNRSFADPQAFLLPTAQ